MKLWNKIAALFARKPQRPPFNEVRDLAPDVLARVEQDAALLRGMGVSVRPLLPTENPDDPPEVEDRPMVG